MPMMIVQFRLEDQRMRNSWFYNKLIEEKNPAKIPRVGAGGRHTNIVLDQSLENNSPLAKKNDTYVSGNKVKAKGNKISLMII